MARLELTNKRPTAFSQWHRRKLPDRCCLTDIDWFEVRESRVVAILETIQISPESFDKAGLWIITDPWLHNWYPTHDERYPLWETKKIAMNFLISKTNKPFYIIYHTSDMQKVRVVDYRRKIIHNFDEETFATWLICKW